MPIRPYIPVKPAKAKSISLNPPQIPVYAVYNRTRPYEPAAISLTLDFSKTDTYTLNGLLFIQQNRFCDIQAVYVDASGTDQQITVTIGGTNQIIRVKGRTQGWYPVVAPNPFSFAVVCEDATFTSCIFIAVNVPVDPGAWLTQ